MGYYELDNKKRWVYNYPAEEYYRDIYGAWTQIINFENPTKRRLNHTVLAQLDVHQLYQDTEGDQRLYFYNPSYGLYFDYVDTSEASPRCYYECETLPYNDIAIGIYHRTSDNTYWQYIYDLETAIIENNLSSTVWHYNEDVYYVKTYDDLDDVPNKIKQRVYQAGTKCYVWYGGKFNLMSNRTASVNARQSCADDVNYINNTMFKFTLVSPQFSSNYTIRGWNYCGFYGDWVQLTGFSESTEWGMNDDYYNAACRPANDKHLYHVAAKSSTGEINHRWKWYVPNYSFVGTDQAEPTEVSVLPTYPTSKYQASYEGSDPGKEFIYYTMPLYKRTDGTYWYWQLDLNLVPLPEAPPGHYYQWITVNGEKSEDNRESISDIFHSYGKAAFDSYGLSYTQNLYFANTFMNGWANQQGNGGIEYTEWYADPGMEVGDYKLIVFNLPGKEGEGARYKMWVRYAEDYCSPTIHWGYVYEKRDEVWQGILYFDTKDTGGSHTGTFSGEQKFSRYNTPWELAVGRETFREQLTTVEFRGEIVPKYLNDWFYKCDHLKSINNAYLLNTIQVLECYETFCECQMLEDIDTSQWSMDKLIDMSYMFQSCRKLKTLDFRYIDPKKLKVVTQAFNECYELEKIYVSSLWNNTTVPANITDDYKMFSQCLRLSGDVSYLDTGGDMTKKRFVYTDGYLTFKERDVVWTPRPIDEDPDIIIKRNPHFTTFSVDEAAITPIFNETDREFWIDLGDQYIAHTHYTLSDDTDEVYCFENVLADDANTTLAIENDGTSDEQVVKFKCKYKKNESKVGDADTNVLYTMHFKSTAKNLPLLTEIKSGYGEFTRPFTSKVLNYTYLVTDDTTALAFTLKLGSYTKSVSVTNAILTGSMVIVSLDDNKLVTITCKDENGRTVDYKIQFVLMPYLTTLFTGASDSEPLVTDEASIYELYVPKIASTILEFDYSRGTTIVKHNGMEVTSKQLTVILPVDTTTGTLEVINALGYTKTYTYRINKREGVDITNITASYRESGSSAPWEEIEFVPTFTKDTTLYTGELTMIPSKTSEIEFTINVGDDVTDVTKIFDGVETTIPESTMPKEYKTTVLGNDVVVDFGFNKQ